MNHCCDTQAICKLRYNNTCKSPTTKTLAKVWKTCPAGKSINTALFLYNISVDHLITINITELLKSKNQNVIMRKILLNLFKKNPKKQLIMKMKILTMSLKMNQMQLLYKILPNTIYWTSKIISLGFSPIFCSFSLL